MTMTLPTATSPPRSHVSALCRQAKAGLRVGAKEPGLPEEHHTGVCPHVSYGTTVWNKVEISGNID